MPGKPFMKVLMFFLKPAQSPIIRVLALVTVVCVSLVLGRVSWTGHLIYAFLVWNLFLAWLPLILSLKLREQCAAGCGAEWKHWLVGAAWLLLFPNAPYIFTDLVHLTTWFRTDIWIDMMLILPCALTGLVLGFVSLYVMQSVVADRFGVVAGWWLVAATTMLSGIGVYLGRFLRWNSWDVLVRPDKLFQGVSDWMTDPFGSFKPYVFSILFAVFLLMAYALFYALTQLPSGLQVPAKDQSERTP